MKLQHELKWYVLLSDSGLYTDPLGRTIMFKSKNKADELASSFARWGCRDIFVVTPVSLTIHHQRTPTKKLTAAAASA